VGETLRIRVLFDGKPLKDAHVFAHNRQGDKVSTQALTTSDEGTVSVKLVAGGPWLLRLVHMQRCKDDDQADWESFWGALSFGK
jgi:uncharacterized GH25 family protein